MVPFGVGGRYEVDTAGGQVIGGCWVSNIVLAHKWFHEDTYRR